MKREGESENNFLPLKVAGHQQHSSLSLQTVSSQHRPQWVLCRASVHLLWPFLLSPKFRSHCLPWILAMNFHKTPVSNHLIILLWDWNLQLWTIPQRLFPLAEWVGALEWPDIRSHFCWLSLLPLISIWSCHYNQGPCFFTSASACTIPITHKIRTPASNNWNIIQMVHIEEYCKYETIMISPFGSTCTSAKVFLLGTSGFLPPAAMYFSHLLPQNYTSLMGHDLAIINLHSLTWDLIWQDIVVLATMHQLSPNVRLNLTS